MKNISRIPLYLLAAMTLAACSPFDLNMDDLEVKVDLNVIKTNVTVSFEDVATGQEIGSDGDKEIRVRFAGRDAHLIIDNSGNYLTEVNTTAGLVSFGLDPYETAPSEDRPAEIVLDIEVDGYLSTTWPVSIYGEGANLERVFLASSVNPPKGVSISKNEEVGDARNGLIQEEIKIQTAPDQDPVTIAAGTELKTTDGQPLEGKLDITLIQFDPREEEAVKAFPGGLSGTVVDESGNETKAAFASLGFMNIEITDQNGNKAGGVPADKINFSPKADGSVINPNTGQPVKTGDAIPMWGLNESTGKWEFVKNVNASQPLLKNNNRIVVIARSYAVAIPERKYNYSFLVELSNYNTDQTYPAIKFDYSFKSVSNNKTFPGKFNYKGGFTKDFRKLLPHGQYTLTLTYDGTGTCPYEFPKNTDFLLESGDQTKTIEFTYNPPPSIHNVTFLVTVNCTNNPGTTANLPMYIPLRYREQGTTDWSRTSSMGGTGQVSIYGLQMGKTYEVQTLHNNKWTPDPAYEYTLSPLSNDSGLNLTRYLSLNLPCN